MQIDRRAGERCNLIQYFKSVYMSRSEERRYFTPEVRDAPEPPPPLPWPSSPGQGGADLGTKVRVRRRRRGDGGNESSYSKHSLRVLGSGMEAGGWGKGTVGAR